MTLEETNCHSARHQATPRDSGRLQETPQESTTRKMLPQDPSRLHEAPLYDTCGDAATL